MRLERIADAGDPRVAEYRDIADARRGRGTSFVAESRTVVRRLVNSRFSIRSLLVTDTALAGLEDVVRTLPEEIPVYVATPQILQAVAGFSVHRGCLALGERGAEPTIDALVASPAARLVLVLEGVADPDNVGAIFRNAQAFGAGGVLLAAGCADPLSRKAIRVSLAATLHVPFAHVSPWPGAIERLRAAHYLLIALTPRTSAVDIRELGERLRLPERLALLVGGEGAGLSAPACAAADVAARIAMAPGVDSLNVATAAAIALHRLLAPAERPRPLA